MLVLSRKVGQRILLGDDTVITVVRTGRDTVRIGIAAPATVKIIREELKDAPPRQQTAAAVQQRSL